IGKDHRDEPERIDGLVEPVIGVEAGLECERGSGQQRDQGGGERGKRTDTHGPKRFRLAAAPAASRASRSRCRTVRAHVAERVAWYGSDNYEGTTRTPPP